MNKSCLQYARCPLSAWTVPLCVAALLAMTVTLSTESVPLARVWVAGTEPPVSPVSWNGSESSIPPRSRQVHTIVQQIDTRWR